MNSFLWSMLKRYVLKLSTARPKLAYFKHNIQISISLSI